MSAELKVEQVEKSWPQGEFKLGPVSLTVPSGKVVAFLGQNGAGKSTLFELITGNLDATAGAVTLAGSKLSPEAITLRRKIGYMPQKAVLPRWITGHEILTYGANVFELEDAGRKIETAMTYWDCQDYRNKPLAACSHGMQKRVALALAHLNDPPLVVLDEPYSGLDIYHIKALDDMIRKRRETGQTTILSTHIAPYSARMCDVIYVVEQGQVRELQGWNDLSYEDRIKHVEGIFFQ